MKIKVKNGANSTGEIIIGDIAYKMHGKSAEAALCELARLSEAGMIRRGCEAQAAEELEYLCDESSPAQEDDAVPFAQALKTLVERGETPRQMPFYGLIANFEDALAFAVDGLSGDEYDYDREDVFDRFAADPPWWSTLCTSDEYLEIFRLYFDNHYPVS